MAIKGDRQVDAVDISFYVNEVASKGVVVSVSTGGSGVALDSTANVATVAANSSGVKPLGILLQDFVSVDLTRTPINWHKDQAATGDKATILTKGWVVTDKIVTATAGTDAVLTSSGTLMNKPAVASWNSVANPFVGRFRSTKSDVGGFAKVYVDL